MNLTTPLQVKEIAKIIDAKIIGREDIPVTSINEIHKVLKGSITFVDVEKYYDKALYSAATAIIINKEAECPEGKALLMVDDPFSAYNKLAKLFSPFIPITAVVSDTATIGEGTNIEPNVVIGNHVTIGKNCLIRANVTIGDGTIIGDNVIIHPNTAIGNDAFYFNKDKKTGAYKRWHSIGRVCIHNDVEIGAGCTIDKGVSGDTIIGEGTKLDNLVHVGHGVVVGKNCLFAAQVGIAGKTIVQDNVVLYGQVGVSPSLVIGEGAVVLPQSGVAKSIPGRRSYFGSPVTESTRRMREIVAIKRLPEILKKVEKDIKEEDLLLE